MYTKVIPFKDFKDKPRNQAVFLNLTEREVFKLLNPLQRMFKWRDSLVEGDERDLTSEEVVEFYNDLEEVLLASWGEMDSEGLHFRKSGRYDFEESALFAALMVMFVSDPLEANKLLENIMPKGMEELVKKADVNIEKLSNDPTTNAALQAEIARLRARLPEDGTKSDG